MSKKKFIVNKIIFFLLTFSLIQSIFADNSPKQNTTAPLRKAQQQKEAKSGGAEKYITVYYFYANPRCYSCKMIETFTEAAITNRFSAEQKNGTVFYKSVNVEEADNRHYVNDYRLYTKSVIVAEFINGKQNRWKNCDQVWLLLKDEQKFMDYIDKEVSDYLKNH